MPGNGSIVKSIEAATLITPFNIGKPHSLLFDIIRREHKLENEQLEKFVMVGDTPGTDIKFGNNSKIDTILTLSGNTTVKKA